MTNPPRIFKTLSYISALLGFVMFTGSAQAAVFFGPGGGSGLSGEYAQFSDSPFFGLDFSGGYFYLEDFEDFVLDVPGVGASAGGLTRVVSIPTAVDSVDLDDGVLDGSGLAGESWWALGEPGTTWSFDAGALGALPTHVGIVWTDGLNPITFEAFDAFGASLGIVVGDHAAPSPNFFGETDEDRFYGVIDAGGISAITLKNGGGGGIEMDHLQYGNMNLNPIPVPAAFWLFGTALIGLAGFSRRRKTS